MQHPLTIARSGTRSHFSPRGRRCVVALTRARDPNSASDGTRVLADRLWPRSLTKERVAIDLWLKEAAPSGALRRWYGHDPLRWPAFTRKYRAELAGRVDLLRLLDEWRLRDRVTLVYDANDVSRNNAVVLRDVLIARRFAPRAHRS